MKLADHHLESAYNKHEVNLIFLGYI